MLIKAVPKAELDFVKGWMVGNSQNGNNGYVDYMCREDSMSTLGGTLTPTLTLTLIGG